MPASPWRNFRRTEPEVEYLVQLSYLPLVRYSGLAKFARWLLAIQRQLGQTAGIIGYSLLAHPFQRDFWTHLRLGWIRHLIQFRPPSSTRRGDESIAGTHGADLRHTMDAKRLSCSSQLRRCPEPLLWISPILELREILGDKIVREITLK